MSGLAGAYEPKTEAKFEKIPDSLAGVHDAFFVGMTDPYWTYAFRDACKTCNGSRMDGEAACKACDATGKRKYQEVILKYQVPGRDEPVTENCNYKLSGPFKMRDGSMGSATTLYKRFVALSGLQDPQEIVTWYDQHKDEKIPVTLIIEWNTTGKALKVTNVLRSRGPAGPVAAVAQKAFAARDDDEVPFPETGP